jgi:serine/threonine protein kinase
MRKQESGIYSNGVVNYDVGDTMDVYSDERARSNHHNTDYLEGALFDGSLNSYSPSCRSIDMKPSPFSQVFTIMDVSTIMPSKIVVSKEEAKSRTVQWLLTQFLKKMSDNPRFDMGNVVCLRTRNQDLNYDYLLTQMDASLALFPQHITLEAYHSIPCVLEEDLSAFQVIGLLGAGSFGTVLAVRQKDSGQIFAMKVIAKEKFQKHQAEVYMFEEKNILMELDHPYLVKLYMIFQTNAYVYFVMDYFPGGDLFNLMRTKGILSEDQAKVYIAEIIMAIGYLHDQCILYRDLKPENIMLDWQGHIKLIDFGLSKRQPSKDALAYSFVGSEGYTAPEVREHQPYGQRADVYSIGTLLYELLHGFPPFTKFDRSTRTFRISSFNELSIRADLSPEVKDLMFTLLSKDPNHRLAASADTSDLLNHKWFTPLRNQIQNELPLEPPFVPNFNDGSLKIDCDQEKLNQILSDLAADHTLSANQKQNRFVGFSFNSTNTSRNGSITPYSNSISPDASSAGMFRKMASFNLEPMECDTDEKSHMMMSPQNKIKIFKNRTKLTRDNVCLRMGAFQDFNPIKRG